MTQGILYVLHGRRNKVPQANLNLLRELMQTLAQPQAVGFLEGQQQTLEASFVSLQQQVQQVIVVPVLLFAATHVRQDIPQRLQVIKQPEVTLTVVKPLATTAAVYTFLQHQLTGAINANPGRSILLIAHGTPHFAEPYQQLQALAGRLQNELQVKVTAASYIGHHRFTDYLTADVGPLIVQRLFLTDGRIAGKIKQAVQQQVPTAIFLPTLENQGAVKHGILERLMAVDMSV
ncbi:sirohydrochlorin chelatase [Loigolactobacillus binensis]|uniref:Sirohydrochlorin chelatase n=1 Tax=Loigolactobacillus binensis TaxID=2559922 RepID=A0ABW3EBN5_9LACO|nr:CbiX/SirB N-terminal domain-containing protein [Loigolactobacillus binensis]